jgi:hypothetical protein
MEHFYIMKKGIIAIPMLSLLVITFTSSCKKVETTQQDVTTNNSGAIKQKRGIIYILAGIAAVAYVISKVAEGQAHTTTTTTQNPNGTITKVTTTSCEGLGSCGGASKHSASGTSVNLGDPFLNDTRDYELNMKFIKTDDGKIFYGADPHENTSENFNRFFYDDQISYMSEGKSYLVDNPLVLQDLGLTASFEIKGGKHQVYVLNGAKYIQVGN